MSPQVVPDMVQVLVDKKTLRGKRVTRKNFQLGIFFLKTTTHTPSYLSLYSFHDIIEMKWRVLVLLIAGIAMIYFVSLLQDVPYPHPLIIQSFEPEQSRVNEPRQVILSETDDYIYRTHIHYEAAIDSSRGFVHGVDSIKLNVYGRS